MLCLADTKHLEPCPFDKAGADLHNQNQRNSCVINPTLGHHDSKDPPLELGLGGIQGTNLLKLIKNTKTVLEKLQLSCGSALVIMLNSSATCGPNTR